MSSVIAPSFSEERLGDILLRKGIIDETQLFEALIFKQKEVTFPEIFYLRDKCGAM